MNASATQTEPQKNKPGFVAKVRKEKGEAVVFERIGVAWKNQDGSFYIKLAGTQVVSDFMLYEIENTEPQDE